MAALLILSLSLTATPQSNEWIEFVGFSKDERIAAYKGYDVSPTQAHHLIVSALDARVIPVTKIPAVLKEWRNPRHEEFKPRNAWSLFNSFTEVMKGSSLDQRPRATQALHGLLDTTCQVN